MASSCIPTGLRLDLEMVKAAAAPPGGAAAAAAGAHSSPLRAAAAAHSSASSTLSEASKSSSSSVASLSLKRARTPRKRPNQTYNEAAALLASMYPSVFPVSKGCAETAPPRLLGLATALADDPSCSDLLPPFPVLGNGSAAYLLRDTPPTPTPRCPVPIKSCSSPAPVSSVFREFRDAAPSPGTPEADATDDDDLGELDFEDEDGFDADSFLAVDDGVAEGIDSIMGKLSMEKNSAAASRADTVLSTAAIHPYLRSLMVLGLGFRQGRLNTGQALKRHDDESDWWMCPAIPVKEIAAPPAPSVAVPLPASDKKKKKSKKKSLKEIERENVIAVGQCKFGDEGTLGFDHGDAGISALKDPKIGLGLNLNTEEVLKAWCNRGSVFAGSDALESPRSSSDLHGKLADIDLFLDNNTSGVIREGSMLKMRHKQKQCTPLLSNKTRYQSRKGKYVSQASLLRQASEKER
uniref:CCT domain-containing protein n=1 Tax=Oryza punctata TaxID=4537 RepID=A0A0E0LF70_ORYPU